MARARHRRGVRLGRRSKVKRRFILSTFLPSTRRGWGVVVSLPGILQVLLYIALLVAITRPVGAHLARVFNGERTFLDVVLRPVERLIYRLTAVNPEAEQGWVGYTFALLLFSVAGALVA